MILQALKEYYDRKAADSDSGIAPLGWEWKEIPFRVVFDVNGSFIKIEDTHMGDKQAHTFLVPILGEGKGGGTKANLFWENAEYMFGIPVDQEKLKRDGGKYIDKVNERHKCFIEKLKSISILAKGNAVYEAAVHFAETIIPDVIMSSSGWEKVKRSNNKTFVMCYLDEFGKQIPVPEIPVVRNAIIGSSALSLRELNSGIRCLVSGELDELKVLEPPIKGLIGGNKSEYHIVAVNNKVTSSSNGGKTPSFASFMKEKGANSPVGKKASLAYTTALNTLLGKDSRQKMSVGDATAVFWSERKTDLEDEFSDLFGEAEKDNPDKGVAAVERLLASVRTGSFSPEDNTTRFYVLGLAPNSTRVSVRFWHNGTVAEMERRFADWFENLQIAHGPKDKEHLSLWRLLVSIAPLGKSENISPNLAGAVMRSILEGTPYPATLLSSAILRIKAEHEVTYPRAKIIKAFINHNLNQERKLTVSLDKQNANVGYRLGRLFAVLEKVQEEANPGLNATIRDKFYASASSTPNAVYGNLMRLKNHHLGKLSQGRMIYFEKLLGDIISEIPSFPAHLTLNDQGQFAIGYYHQRQDFFVGKRDKSAGVGDTKNVSGEAESLQAEFSL